MGDNDAVLAQILAGQDQIREHIDGLTAEAKKEHDKMWIAIRAIKKAIKHKPSKFTVMSSNKLLLAVIPGVITLVIALNASSKASNAQADLARTDTKAATAQVLATETKAEVVKNCNNVIKLRDQRLSSLRQNWHATKSAPTPDSSGQIASARAYYIKQAKATKKIHC